MTTRLVDQSLLISLANNALRYVKEGFDEFNRYYMQETNTPYRCTDLLSTAGMLLEIIAVDVDIVEWLNNEALNVNNVKFGYLPQSNGLYVQYNEGQFFQTWLNDGIRRVAIVAAGSVVFDQRVSA